MTEKSRDQSDSPTRADPYRKKGAVKLKLIGLDEKRIGVRNPKLVARVVCMSSGMFPVVT